MKLSKNGLRIVATMAVGLGAFQLSAQEAATLTRSQWLKKVGPSVAESDVLRETMARLVPGDKVEFAQKVIRAATRLPVVSPDEKSAVLVKTATACIVGTAGETKQQVIAEVFAGVPVAFLPVVTEELAKRFEQTFNKLSDEQYGQIAEETLDAAVKRNAGTDVPSVRNTFVILAFQRGAKDPALKNRLISRLPDERMRNLAASWIPPAFNDKNYDALLAAADVEETPVRMDVMLLLVGHSTLDALLADLVANQSAKAQVVDESGTNVVQTVWVPLSQVRTAGDVVGTALSSGQYDHAPDYGINRVPMAGEVRYPYPGGYQGQGVSVKPVPVPLPVRR
jgi:hypothetical protein